MPTTTVDYLRRSQLLGMLELVCQEIELTETQYAAAEERYNSIARWLADSPEPLLQASYIYPQGSVALQTTVKPLKGNEHDVDLVCFVPKGGSLGPAGLKRLIGFRLKSNGRYEPILEEKPRCWRINYAGEFHLDITPSVPNPQSPNGGELVPDKSLRAWKATNPRGYRSWFEDKSATQPTVLLYRPELRELKAEIEALPGPTRLKGFLRRCVQLCKRHRDGFFSDSPELAPISILLTTLIAKSYAAACLAATYDTEFDLLLAVLRGLPAFIEVEGGQARHRYFVWNETTNGENFAEKWNLDEGLPKAFFTWHRQALSAFEDLPAGDGLDTLDLRLSKAFGEGVVKQSRARHTTLVSSARTSGVLSATPSVGLTVGGHRGTAVRPNTFYGG